MKNLPISEILYGVVIAISLYQSITIWEIDPQKAYIFVAFAVISFFMIIFRYRYRKKFNQRKKDK